MRLIAVGRLKDGPERALLERYQQRLNPKLEMIEVAEGRGAPVEIKRREAQALLACLPTNALVVALDEGGERPDSVMFSQRLETWLGSARPLCFLIGGAEGLDATVMARSDTSLSLGPMTWPHMLVRGLLAEQLYRARAISTGHPYHRAGRP
ncbi:23S rRNA (pseudouridine(1915)-N(3))-methyltransferase RlmH [Lichenicola cladoniae]|uniref:Ribosomal RNA large subunit methyltransferase H n=1 Tax=Lichenicola cladoniae TaxID=1484109 RepID=A0A6M8HSF6_9PROT|nr:23S rRNA (pseudouridine(1915)-N(3))-methyltransferase RlmH [Lichenicola cladoniae]NPD65522.1 23S rRNA (pseudouridine(1915)-N(3))-methyltransferase RlmH [Acetobacteraceae bacterium]QKE91424.1 23S rRNA (pseudouridine(1915)-N(3))-methyltransferase RlmH [Lichenicola cladoniae]